jgi:hypothetical protein
VSRKTLEKGRGGFKNFYKIIFVSKCLKVTIPTVSLLKEQGQAVLRRLCDFSVLATPIMYSLQAATRFNTKLS